MDNNIALIAALFNEKGANFYKDIYFPIIRYSLISLFNEHDGSERYFQIQDLQQYIKGKFFIEIPVVVLRNSVVALRGSSQADLQIETMGSHNENIYIKRLVDPSENDAIDREAESIEDKFSLLENLFQQYLAAEHLDSKTNLYDFISECQEECFALVVGGDAEQAEKVGAEFSNTTRFVSWLKENRTDLYQYFEDILWSAVIASFLRRQEFDPSIKPTERVSYYLDSALVLALLGLDTEYNVSYAKDVKDNVNASGGILKVHGMTIREVTRILESVIKDQAPRFGSAIAFGFEEQQLSLSDIVKIKNTLSQKLTTEYGVVIETLSDQQISEADRKLENNRNVHYLKEKWGGFAPDLRREKHDVFMCELLGKQNADTSHTEKLKAFFVTLNRDLINLYHKSDGLSTVITPGNVVLKLWIHGAQSTVVRGRLLTELMSRCMALAQTDARRKIKLFCKYRKDDVSAQDAKDMYSSLIYRSNDVIMKFNDLESLDQSDSEKKDEIAAQLTQGIIDGMREEAAERHRLFNEQAHVTSKLKEDISLLESSVKSLTTEKSENEKTIENLQKKDADNQMLIRQLQEEVEKRDKANEIKARLELLNKQKAEMDELRRKSISMTSYWVVLVLDCILLLAVGFFLFIIGKNYITNKQLQWDKSTILATISLLGFLFRIRDVYWLKPRIKHAQCKKEQTQYWEEQHPEYEQLKQQISETEKELKAVKFEK